MTYQPKEYQMHYRIAIARKELLLENRITIKTKLLSSIYSYAQIHTKQDIISETQQKWALKYRMITVWVCVNTYPEFPGAVSVCTALTGPGRTPGASVRPPLLKSPFDRFRLVSCGENNNHRRERDVVSTDGQKSCPQSTHFLFKYHCNLTEWSVIHLFCSIIQHFSFITII